jgi:hypothetical protein
VSLVLRFKCDHEGCEAVYDMPYNDDGPAVIDASWGAYANGQGNSPASGWIDGSWQLPEGWSCMPDGELCPTHAEVIDGDA